MTCTMHRRPGSAPAATGIPRSRQRLHLARMRQPPVRPRPRRHLRTPPRALALIGLALVATPAAAQRAAERAPRSAVILGVVRDTAGRTLAGVHVSAVNASHAVYSRPDGSFLLSTVPPGTQLVRARRIGHAPEVVALVLAAGDTAEIDFVLRPVQELPTVVTEGERVRNRNLLGFEERRRSGFGRFIDRAQLDQWQPSRPSDVLRRVAGLTFTYDEQGRKRLTFARSAGLSGQPCPPLFYLDGVQYPIQPDEDVDVALPPIMEIEGIEIYKGVATVPATMNAPGAACGVIALWTR